MAKYNWTDITREDVILAIQKFNKYNPEYPDPKSTFLLYEGKKLPAKHIRGMAYTEHYGVEISKNDFGGGMETVRFFERLGFQTIHNKVTHEPVIKKKISKKSEPEMISEKSKRSEENKRKCHDDRIIVPTKQVIEQKNALQLILNKMFDGDVVCEKTYPWLKTPEVIEEEYKKVYGALFEYRGNEDFAKKMLHYDVIL